MTDLRKELIDIAERASSLSFNAEGTQDDVRQAFDYISWLAYALLELEKARDPGRD